MMRNVWDALSLGYRGGYAGSAAELESRLVAAIRAGDVIMVKGWLGSRMKPMSTRSKSTFPTKPHPTMWRRKVV
jgi:UDP-N-acetylmuramoyl-tripeptide--D-alanyl-D-alanine ligase